MNASNHKNCEKTFLFLFNFFLPNFFISSEKANHRKVHKFDLKILDTSKENFSSRHKIFHHSPSLFIFHAFRASQVLS